MALIDWSPTYSVKVRKFDDQHKKLIDLINQLHDGMKAGEGNAVLGGVLQSLLTYTRAHFGEEVSALQMAGYPDATRHKSEHEKFVAQVLDLQEKYRSGAHLLTLSTRNFLKNWLVNHIQVEDRKYSQFLNAKGIC